MIYNVLFIEKLQKLFLSKKIILYIIVMLNFTPIIFIDSCYLYFL